MRKTKKTLRKTYFSLFFLGFSLFSLIVPWQTCPELSDPGRDCVSVYRSSGEFTGQIQEQFRNNPGKSVEKPGELMKTYFSYQGHSTTQLLGCTQSSDAQPVRIF